MTEGTVTAPPPSPPHSVDGHYNISDDSRSNPAAALKPGLSTPPMPTRPIMSQTPPQPSFDPYGDPSLYHTAPTPVYYTPRTMITSAPSHTPPHGLPEQGIHTRSGRALGTPSSPDTATESTRASQSPLARSRRTLKKKPYKKGGPIVEQPLSVLTKDYSTPVRDMAVWVNRPISERMAEVDRKKGYISRPMNSFMLYRAAYADRVKQFCKENNHQVVSQVTGASWPLEPKEIRELYEQLAMTERDNHQAAHPNYKFAPNKGGKRSRRDNDDDSDSDPDWEGSTRGSKRGRRFDSRSASSTPFEEAPPRYHALPSLNLSGYEISNPYGSQPIIMGPNGMLGHYYQATTAMAPYSEQVSDIKYERMEDPFPPYQATMGLVGMPHSGHHELLSSHPAPRPMASTQANMLDPRLAQSDPEFHFGYYDGAMGMVQEAPRTITYEPAPPAGYQPAEAYHPGLATLTEEHDVWGEQGHTWSDFEAEFQKLA